MTKNLYRVLAVIMLALSGWSHGAPARYLGYDQAALERGRARLAAHDPLYLPAYQALIGRADRALLRRRYSVVDKTLVPRGGDRHEYLSLSPYWWPNPHGVDGLPYLRKDGMINPSAKDGRTDATRMVAFSRDMTDLALAYYFSRDPRYARQAALLARAWFVDPATRMNPDLEHAQEIPGVDAVRGIGILDGRVLVDVSDAIELIRPADVLSEADYQAVRRWYGELDHWLLSSVAGFDEQHWHNNHGTYFDEQVVAFSLFCDQPELARRQLRIAAMSRIGGHFDSQGRQVAELERTRPFHYSAFNLEAFGRLGRYGELVHVDLWHFSIDGHDLHQGYRFLAGYVGGEPPWPYADLDRRDEDALVPMLMAARAYPDPLFRQKARDLLHAFPDRVEALTWPLNESSD